jgi:hypothetical protein
VDRDRPQGPDGGEPFPTFDPEFTPSDSGPRGPRRPAPDKPQPNPWLVGAAIGVVLATISVVAFGLFGSDDSTVAGSTTTTSPQGGSTTTLPPDGSTTTVTGGTGTTVTLPGNGGGTAIDPVGDPIPIAELTMSSNDIGPLDFGTAADEVLGRFVSTFGSPTDDTGYIVGSGSFGECPGDTIRVVRWGPLNIVVRGEVGSAVFASYRLDLRYGGVNTPPTDLATLSGLRVGNTVGELESIYAGFAIEFVVDQDVGLVFELRASQTDPEVLLWGPVDSQAEDALVTGIYSPDSCETASTGDDA